jgi:hypothetical protein
MFDFASTPAATVDLTVPNERGGHHALLVRSTGKPFKQQRQHYVPSELYKQSGEIPPIDDAAAVARAFGMTPGEHGWAACPLPGHGWTARVEPRPSHRQGHRATDELHLVCDCTGTELRWDGGGRTEHEWSLADAYHAIRTGRVLGYGDKLAKGQRFVWLLLLAHELGLVTPVDVHLPALPPDASDATHRVHALFGRLAGLRLAVGSTLLMPFGVTVVQDVCGLSRGAAHDAIRALVAAGVIAKAGEEPGRFPQPAFLYEPSRPRRPDAYSPSDGYGVV